MRGTREVLPRLKEKRIKELLEDEKRVDGRALDAYRPITIKMGTSDNAAGSAEVHLGNTKVIVGVKIEVGEPFADFPDEGSLIVSANFLSVASPTFRPGPPSNEEIILARVIDRALRSSEAIDFKQLCIESGKKVFIVFVDIGVLDQDGNLLDASMMATLAALMSAKQENYEVQKGEIVPKPGYHPLPLKSYPLLVTLWRIGKNMIVDACLDEELGSDASISVGVDENGNICTVQKGVGVLSIDDVLKSVDLATDKYKELIERLKSSVGEEA